MAIYSDNFNRADGDEASGNWTVNTGDWNIASNRLTKTSGDGFIRYNTDLGSADHFCEADVVNQLASGCYTVLDVRRNTSNNDCYQAYASIDTGTFVIGRVISGSYSHITLGSSFTSPFTGRLRLEVQGSTLRLYVNGVLDITTTNTEITSGNYVGLNGFSGSTNENQWDNFVGGTLPAAGAAKSVRFDAGSDRYSRVATGIAAPDMTWCAWVKLYEDPDYYQSWMSVDNASTYHKTGTGGNGTTLWIDTNGGTWGDTTPFDLVPGQWAFVGSVYRSGSPGSLFHAQAADAAVGYYTHSANNLDAPNPALTFYIGASGFGDNIHGLMAQVKVWSAALTEAEINAEFKLDGVARTSGLWAYYSFRDGIQTSDESGNGRTLTAGGSIITDLDGPPVTPAGWTTFSEGVSTATNATVTGLTNGTAYEFRVIAVNAVGESVPSATAGPYTPTAPVNYNETGRSVAITSTVTTTERNGYKDLARSVVVASTITTTDVQFFRYNETGRAVAIVSAITTTDALKRGETGRSVAIISTVTMPVDQTDYDMLDLGVAAVATVSSTDLIKRGETGRAVAIVSATTTTDLLRDRELDRSVAIVAGVTVTDLLTAPGHFDETNRAISILATLTLAVDQADLHDVGAVAATATVTNAVDQTDYDQLNLPVAVVATVTSTDLIKRGELARPVAIVATTSLATDQADWHETNLPVAVASTVAHTAAVKLGEANRPVAIVATVATPTDRAGRKEPNLGVATVATNILAVDQADFKDLARGVVITSTVTSLDVMSGAPINYTETNLKVIVVSTLTSTDRASFHDSSSVAIVSATTLTFALRGYETQRSVAIASTMTTTDQADFKDIASPVAIVATVTNVGTVRRSDLDKAIAISSTVALTDHAEFNDALALGAATSVAVIDRVDAIEVRSLAILATISVFDLQSYAGGVVLNRALAIYLGEQPVSAVYVGATKVWP